MNSMKLLRSELFETVHPMTYLLVIKSMAWGALIILDAMSRRINLLTVDDMLWPIPLTYVWAALLVLLGALMIFFFLRDHCARDKNRIWNTAKINVSLWVFAGTFWFITVGSQVMIVISLFNIIGFVYIGLASKVSRPEHRV